MIPMEEMKNNNYVRLAILLLLIAYIPKGPSLLYSALGLWNNKFYAEVIGVPLLWANWLFATSILANLQIIASLVFINKECIISQNKYLKSIALIGQLSWIYPLGWEIYPWYFWVIGSALLFHCTQSRKFTISEIFRLNASKNN